MQLGIRLYVLSWSLAGPLAAQSPIQAWTQAARHAEALQQEGKSQEALDFARLALQLAKPMGATDDHLASSYYLLGAIYLDSGHCPEARANYARALAIWDKQPDPKPNFMLNSILSAVTTACDCDDYEAAKKLLRTHAQALDRAVTNSRDRAKVLSMQAAIELGSHHYRAAEAFFQQAIALFEASPDSRPLDVAESRSALAMVLGKLKRHEEALQVSLLAIADFDRLSSRHPSLVSALNNAACSLAELDRKQEAARMFERALALATDLFGEDNRSTARIMLSYARVLRENHETPAAEAMNKKGAAAFHRSLLRDGQVINAREAQLATH